MDVHSCKARLCETDHSQHEDACHCEVCHEAHTDGGEEEEDAWAADGCQFCQMVVDLRRGK